jgi:hypothetical protein
MGMGIDVPSQLGGSALGCGVAGPGAVGQALEVSWVDPEVSDR